MHIGNAVLDLHMDESCSLFADQIIATPDDEQQPIMLDQFYIFIAHSTLAAAIHATKNSYNET